MRRPNPAIVAASAALAAMVTLAMATLTTGVASFDLRWLAAAALQAAILAGATLAWLRSRPPAEAAPPVLGRRDAGPLDAGPLDAGPLDAGPLDTDARAGGGNALGAFADTLASGHPATNGAAPSAARPGSDPVTDSDAVARLRFDNRLERALEGARNEDALFTVIHRALDSVPPSAPTELLLAGGHERAITQVVEAGPDGEGPGCPVADSGECEAMRTGLTQRYDHSDELDACAHLRDRMAGACSAVCVPVQILGRSVGVLHRSGPAHYQADDRTVGYLESVSRKVGVRLGLLRSTSAGREMVIDPITGALDRASVEARIIDLARNLTPFSLAQCDLDHFQDFTRTYGREFADRAIRLVAQVLSEILRPGDVVGRFGDDELLIVLPHATNGAAQGALERAREHLALTLSTMDLPPFTCSFGVVESGFGSTLEDLLVAADVAVSLAKDLGRNRVVVAGDQLLDPRLGDD